MRTLYDRLKPHVKEKLENYGKEFPATTKSLTDDLKKNYDANELMLGSCRELVLLQARPVTEGLCLKVYHSFND